MGPADGSAGEVFAAQGEDLGLTPQHPHRSLAWPCIPMTLALGSSRSRKLLGTHWPTTRENGGLWVQGETVSLKKWVKAAEKDTWI